MRAYGSGNVDNEGQWGDLGRDGGAIIAAHTTREVTIVGAIIGVDNGTITAEAFEDLVIERNRMVSVSPAPPCFAFRKVAN